MKPGDDQQAVAGVREAIVEDLDRAQHVTLHRLRLLRRAGEPDAVGRVEAGGDDREKHVDELRERVLHQVLPVIGTSAPVTPLDSRDDRNRMTLLTSRGDGHSFGSAFGIASRFTGWSIVVGRIAFTVIPSPFTSAASDSVHLAIAPLLIA